MVLAMMIPMVIIPMRTAAVRSLWRRRHRAIACFLLGYVAVWLFAGIVALPLIIVVGRAQFGWAFVGIGAFLVATLWQVSPWKQRAKFSCHRTIPLAPTGWKADWDCTRYGLVHGHSCFASCWALMLAPMLVLHTPITMLAAGLVCAYERYWAHTYDRNIARGLAWITAGMLLTALVTWLGKA
jgi:predicted metal-binding membrane protein